MFVYLTGFTAVSFYLYGFSCLRSARMVAEFERYGLARFRALTGCLQLAGALGLTFGIWGYPLLGFWAAAGLSLQMAFGVAVRLRIGDSCWECLPALFYCALNGYIAYLFLGI
jgi:hypothetical protein